MDFHNTEVEHFGEIYKIMVKATKDSWHEVVKAVKLSGELVMNKYIHKLEKARMWQGILLKCPKGQFGSRVRPKSSERKLEES
jgi:hypothetical protein